VSSLGLSLGLSFGLSLGLSSLGLSSLVLSSLVLGSLVLGSLGLMLAQARSGEKATPRTPRPAQLFDPAGSKGSAVGAPCHHVRSTVPPRITYNNKGSLAGAT